jgi:hypothetical protein
MFCSFLLKGLKTGGIMKLSFWSSDSKDAQTSALDGGELFGP